MSLVGQHVGRIRIVAVIGSGGMGEVYEGFDEDLKRKVAVKALSDRYRLDDDAKGRLEREAVVLSQIEHPHICRVYDFIRSDLADFIVMELVQGESLTRQVARGLTRDVKLGIAAQIADALLAAHTLNIVHRDLKPDNIMVTSHGQVKILDFGLAQSVVDANAPTVTLSHDDSSSEDVPGVFKTRKGYVMGTPMFMSPEQARGDRLTVASDVYAFGLLLQWMFMEELPHDAELSRAQLLWKTMSAETRPVVGLERDLARLVEDMKNPDAVQRPRAREVLDRVLWLIDKPKRRVRRWLWGLAIGSLLVGTAVSSWGFFVATREKHVAEMAAHESEMTRLFMHDVLTAANPRAKGRDVSIIDALSNAEERLESVQDEQVRASIHHTFADIYEALGETERAGTHVDLAYKSRKAKLGETDLRTLETLHLLAKVLTADGNYEQALQKVDEVIGERESQLGSDHPDTQASRRLKAQILIKTGAFDQAKRLLEGLLETHGRVDPLERETKAALQQELGSVYYYQGNFAEAERLFRGALTVFDEIHGEDHPDNLNTRQNLVGVLVQQGRMDEVVPLMDRIVASAQTVYGIAHPDTLAFMMNRAVLAINMRDFVTASQQANLVAERASAAYGRDHPLTLKAQFVVSSVLEYQGDAQSAIDGYRKVNERQIVALGPEHPDTLETQRRLVGVLRSAGLVDESYALSERVYPLTERLFGTTHPNTLRAGVTHASILMEKGRLTEAEDLLLVVMTRCDNAPLELVHAQRTLARVKNQQKDYKAVETLLTEALKGFETYVGKAHADWKEIAEDLVQSVRDQADTARADSLAAELFETQ
ncbi:MAG: tetratricopeptide repeat protein [Acidobacteria bacterium]|nr:tetratricopeptide repeat protein [Acidobacteriota bacterium]